MRRLDEFMPFVQLLASTADPMQIQEATRSAVIRFMRDSQVFDDYLTLPVQPQVFEYVLDPPECRVIVGVKGVKVNGSPYSEWQRDSHEDVIMFRAELDRSCVEVNYTWTIGRDDCDIPEKVYEDYMPVIEQASLAKLHTMFGTSVVSASRAETAERAYQGLLADVLGRKIFNFSNSRPKMHRQRRGHNRLGW